MPPLSDDDARTRDKAGSRTCCLLIKRPLHALRTSSTDRRANMVEQQTDIRVALSGKS